MADIPPPPSNQPPYAQLPGPPQYAPPPQYGAPPQYAPPAYAPTPGQSARPVVSASPGMIPPPIGPGAPPVQRNFGLAAAGVSASQFGRQSIYAIVIGVASVVAPFTINHYFIVLPIFGFMSSVTALRRGQLIGGILGIAANVLGGLASLLASGLLFR